MDTEAFVRWALDDARTVEERYTTELIVERGETHWHYRRGEYGFESLEDTMERKRQRAFNPAYDPRCSEQSLRRAAEAWTQINQWMELGAHDTRPIRDLKVLRFLTALESLHLLRCEVDDLTPLTALPRLRALHFSSHTLRDFRPLAHCTGLWDLQLHLLRHWPEVRGLETLPAVESLLLHGNILVFERAVFPRVKSASLLCDPLEARSVQDLPRLPACEFLSLGGVEQLDGVENYPRLRNLVIHTSVESFAPLARLPRLTCLTIKELEPLDVTPLTLLPALQYLCFDTQFKIRLRPVPPRDLAPLTEAPALRELEVLGNPLLETEAAALQVGLPSWGDALLHPEPRPLPPWRLLAWPAAQFPPFHADAPLPAGAEHPDLGLRARERRWVARFVSRALTKKLGTSDWGEPYKDYSAAFDHTPHMLEPAARVITFEFTCYGLVEKIPLVVEALRECLAQLRPDYVFILFVSLQAPARARTPADMELEAQFSREQDEAEYKRSEKEREAYLERLHRYELKKQAGEKVKPEDFAPGERAPLPLAPWEREEEDGDSGDSGGGEGGVAVKEKPEPPPSWEDDAHPLADKYCMMAHFTRTECYVFPHHRGIAEYLLCRPCDEVIEEKKK